MCDGIVGKILGCNIVPIYDRYYNDNDPSEATEEVVDDMYIESVIEALRVKKVIYRQSICKRCGKVIKADVNDDTKET